ncbi:MAG: hypothetical protein ABWY55_06665 [Microbacterium sp.]
MTRTAPLLEGPSVNPDPALAADLRTGRRPVTGHDDPDGDLRVFALQYRIDLAHAESIETYRTAMRALMDELVVPHLVPGRPTLVVYPEAVGLPVLAIGERGRRIRELAAGPVPAPGPDGMPATLMAGMSGLAEASIDRIGAYMGLFGPEAIDIRTIVHLAGTDTAARAFSQTFSDIARDYGVWVVAGNYQPTYRETSDDSEVRAFGIPGSRVAYVATTPRVTNATFLWAPHEVDPGAPAGETNLVMRNEKIPLTEMELELLGLAEGPAEGDEARENAGWADVAGFRVGFATSLPAFAYGYPFGARPADFDAFADLRATYAAAQDALGVDVMIQADANPGPWAAPVASGAWQPLEWMASTWRAVADPTVSFRYNVTPMMTGNLLDLMFDGQSSITARGPVAELVESRHFVGNAASGPDDTAEYDMYAGAKPEFLAVSEWVSPDAPREQLMAVTAALAPGSGSELENGYVETAIYADLRLPSTRPGTGGTGGAERGEG